MTGDELKAFPKIHALGTRYVESIFDRPVEITEKVDGSQFVFGKFQGEIKFRSKGRSIYQDSVDNMFKTAVDVVLSMDLPDDAAFYCEYLQKPKHNMLAYDRTPEGHLILFGMSDFARETMVADHNVLSEWAARLGVECVPLLFSGETTAEAVLDLLTTDSVLGGQKIEGVVVKNYKDCTIAERIYPVMAAKFVSEAFKEIHKTKWGPENTSVGKWETFKEGHRTEARWMKAVQHLRDDGRLEGEPRDIGNLIKEVHRDIGEEEKENIKEFLYRQFGAELIRRSTAGLPEWYKEQIALGNIPMTDKAA